jgi:hypothetical protein
MAIDVSISGWRKAHADDPERDGDLRERIVRKLRRQAAAIPAKRAVDMRARPSPFVFRQKGKSRGR